MSSSACNNGEEVTISFIIHIDKHFIRMLDCEVLENGLIPVCVIGSGKCSLVFTSYNISDNYVVHCPIIIKNDSYGITSEKIDLAGDLQPCSSMQHIS